MEHTGDGRRPARGATRRRSAAGALAGALLAVAGSASGLEATNVQTGSRWTPVWGAPSADEAARAPVVTAADVFIIEPPVGLALRELWRESMSAAKERVACLGGYFDERERAVHVTRLERVTARADSLRSEAGPSLEKCAPPMWSGTVHTHIALYRGQPFSTFSSNDRAVMGLWRSRWRTEGLFCVLYSETLAYCEWGPALSADVAYNETPAPILTGE